VNARAYAALEKEQGVAATYFVQAKYVQDWNDDIFMDEKAGPILRDLHGAGAEVASHSVSHSRAFKNFPLGTGRERYPEYRPFVLNGQETLNASILGELRVSKFLLEHLVPGLTVRSFRPGYLRNPYELPQALAGTGYRFSSSASANNALTHLPFRLTHNRDKTAPVAVYEFPVTIEDESPPALPQRLDAALSVADRIARYGGLFMVMIHTDSVGDKLEFQRRLTRELQTRGAWFGRLDTYADWWSARDRVEVAARRADNALMIRLRSAEPVVGLALDLPGQSWRLVRGAGEITLDGSRLVVDLRAGDEEFELQR
jgi:peptidoglycan/xylan/chitin deacetylase (PgdA/CDA1 family)